MTSITDHTTSSAPIARPDGPALGWWVVCRQELRDLWFTFRGPGIVLGFTILLSLLTYLAAANKELNIIDQRDTVNLVIQITVILSVAAGLLFTADAISGERERETLESLLVTPVSRRQIEFGKFLAAISVWPVMLIISVPYLYALRIGSSLFTDAVLGAAVIGTLLVIAFSCLGLILSTFSGSNRLSLAFCFFIFVLLLAPTQLPLSGWFGNYILKINPMTAGSTFLNNVISKEHAWSDELNLLISPIASAVLTATAAFIVAARLRLQGTFGR